MCVFLVIGLFEHRDDFTIWVALGALVWLIAAFVVGDNMRRRRTEIAEFAERAERAERERELLAGQRVTEERTRIARELHDIVAHSVSVMVIQATAARRNLGRDQQATETLLGNIEETGRQTMGELRQILGVLRDAGDGSTAPMVPVLCDLDALVTSIPDLDVRLSGQRLARRGPDRRGPRPPTESSRRRSRTLTAMPARTSASTSRCRAATTRVDVRVSDNGRGASTRPRPDRRRLRPDRDERTRRRVRWHARHRTSAQRRLGGQGDVPTRRVAGPPATSPA